MRQRKVKHLDEKLQAVSAFCDLTGISMPTSTNRDENRAGRS